MQPEQMGKMDTGSGGGGRMESRVRVKEENWQAARDRCEEMMRKERDAAPLVSVEAVDTMEREAAVKGNIKCGEAGGEGRGA